MTRPNRKKTAGLGLAISKRILKSHRGDINLVDSGSTALYLNFGYRLLNRNAFMSALDLIRTVKVPVCVIIDSGNVACSKTARNSACTRVLPVFQFLPAGSAVISASSLCRSAIDKFRGNCHHRSFKVIPVKNPAGKGSRIKGSFDRFGF